MPITGRITTSANLDGPYERVNDALLPSEVTVKLVGDLGEPDAVARFELIGGRPTCTEFLVKMKPEGRGLRSGDLAMLNLDGIAESAFLDFATPMTGGALGGDTEQQRWELRGDISEAIHAPGRGPSMAELREVARIYQQFPAAPTRTVMQMLGVSKRTASRRVSQAREAGLL